ncbi:MAG TPA: methyl-accepting chemotaxis protein [Burkholderiales bacterium]|nr:methyl-accepting chemotaxis protein [Burkholderiales bacterium]
MASILSKLRLPARSKPADGADAPARGSLVEEIKRAGARPTPFIGAMPFERQARLLGSAIIVLVCIAAGIAFSNARFAAHNAAQIEIAGEMRMLTQRQPKAARLAVEGQEPAFAQLQDSRDRFARDLALLVGGGEHADVNLPPSSEAAQGLLGGLSATWEVSKKNADAILAAKALLIELGRSFDAVNARNADLLDATEQLAALMVQGGSAQRDLAAANELVMLTQRIAKNANLLHVGETIDQEAAFLLSKDINDFAERVRGLTAGSDTLRLGAQRNPDVREQLDALAGLFNDYQTSVVNVVQRMRNLAAAKQAGLALTNDSEKLLAATEKLIDQYQGESGTRTWLGRIAIVCAAIALALLLLLGKALRDDADRRAHEEAEANRKTQEAILRLLDEMQTLSDGDLTVRARVSEDVTGAIADSVNLTVEELRKLVTGVIGATGQVATKTTETRQVSGQLLEAAQRQAGEIQDTGAAVVQMAQSINEVSARAADSAKVAEASLNAAAQGAAAVRNAMSGMNTIREQIQETAKRIKRLGESSQEIGEIVDLISDITEQTNVLALNAAIQASAAGPAGRGFTVVAEEVQRLAERSAESTKQIGAIVKTIQGDTHDAVAAMERSTQGVVDGTRLAESAGQALAQIEQVSKQLATLIEAISAATRAQNDSATRVSTSMKDILRITELTTEGTRRTATLTVELARLAEDLKSSVARFKLE